MRERLILGLAIAIAACSGPKTNPQQHIVVREFEVSPTATMITNYDASTDGLGMAGADRLASVLRAYGHDAVAVPHDAEGTGDLEVTARITRIDGGNRGKRILVSQTIGFGFTSYGIGGSTCALEGQATRPGSATPVGSFGLQLTKAGVGWFWIRYGESSERQIRGCLLRLSANVATMIHNGEYVDNRRTEAEAQPASVAPAQPVARPVADRLRELDQLRDNGLITQHEYEQRRAAILEAL